jgi:hypothetical protein
MEQNFSAASVSIETLPQEDGEEAQNALVALDRVKP